jgi:acyl carrier protein
MSTQADERVATVSDEVADFIVNDLGWDGPKGDLLADEPTELPSILDSPDLLELAGFLEEKYEIEVSAEEITAENFASVLSLARVVVAKQSATEVG